MAYVFWALLNLGVFLLFIGICFRATKLVRTHLGLWSSIIFVFGLLSFVGNSSRNRNNMNRDNSDRIPRWTFVSRDSIVASTSRFAHITLDKKLLISTNLLVLYGQNRVSTQWMPVEATATQAGFTGGYVWKPSTIKVTTTPTPGKLGYEVDGLLEWHLLGATVYTEVKKYAGFIDIKAD